jgi:subtilisin-like proprotein convertase family protein
MKFRMGTSEPLTGEPTLQGELAPNLTIPDNSPVGITSVLKLSHPKTVGSIEVSFDIQHTYIGDLRVELVSPTGRGVLLHSRLGGGKDDLVAHFESKMPGSPLAALLGQPIEGSWMLRVSDEASRDKGKLRKWSLKVTPKT